MTSFSSLRKFFCALRLGLAKIRFWSNVFSSKCRSYWNRCETWCHPSTYVCCASTGVCLRFI